MCGRYSFTSPPEAMRKLFGLGGALPNFPPRYNIAPTQNVPVVRLDPDSSERVCVILRWGLVPSWSKGPDHRYSMINARAETVAQKPAYRSAFKSRRCLVPADGFYEWQKRDGGKQPYRLAMADDAPFAFAGLWERWQGDDEIIESFTVVVTDANDLVRPIHDRMPVILSPTDYGTWLTGTVIEADTLMLPFPADAMSATPVSTRINNVRNDDAECIVPLSEPIGRLL